MDTDATAVPPARPQRRSEANEFRVVWSVARAGFDPHLGPEHLAIPFMTPVYDRLVRMNADGSLAPMLAERWTFSARGRRLSIALRDDVHFHDGSPLDSAAVRSTLVRGQSPSASPAIRQHLGQIGAIELDGHHALHLEIGERAAGLPAVLATAAGMILDTRSRSAVEPILTPLGSGPFVLDTAGERARDDGEHRFVRAPEHWNTSVPRASAFSIGELTDHRDRLDALLRGDADIVDVRGEAYVDAARHASTGRIQLASYPSTTTVMLQFDRRSDVLGDVRLRRAIAMAIDRPSVVALYGPQAEPTGQCAPPSSSAHEPSLDGAWQRDVPAARRLVARAGGRGRALRLLQFEAVEPATTLLARVADDLRAVGFRVEVTSLPPAELVPAWQAGGFDLRITHATSLPGVAFELDRRLNPAQQPGDLARFSSALPPLVARLHDQRMSAAATDDLHREINRRMVDDCVTIELCRLRCDVAAAPHIIGADRLPFATFNLFDATDVTVATPREPYAAP